MPKNRFSPLGFADDRVLPMSLPPSRGITHVNRPQSTARFFCWETRVWLAWRTLSFFYVEGMDATIRRKDLNLLPWFSFYPIILLRIPAISPVPFIPSRPTPIFYISLLPQKSMSIAGQYILGRNQCLRSLPPLRRRR